MDDDARTGDPVPWLDPDQRLTWLALIGLVGALPASVESQLGRDAELTFFEYSVLAALSERPDRTLPMSRLALMANGSLSRLSHVARRLEARQYIERRPLPGNGRITIAVLLDAGYRAVEAAAPAHVRHVGRVLFDVLSRAEQQELGRLCFKLLAALDPAAVQLLRDAGSSPARSE